jgi:rubrerythrin
MKFRDQMHHWFLSDLFSTAEGRAYVLSQASEAESGGEKRIFDVLLEQVDDPELARMVKKHSEDEVRHAEMYAECAARQGAKLPRIPAELRVIDKVDEAIARARGGVRFFDEKIHDGRFVMEGYLFLQVLEERAVQQFSVLAEALRPFDPKSADVIVEIEADERRHLRYCHAISKRYAPSPVVLDETLAKFRRAEAEAYQAHTSESLAFLLDQGFLRSRSKTLLWRGIGALTSVAALPWTDAGRPVRGQHLAAA